MEFNVIKFVVPPIISIYSHVRIEKNDHIGLKVPTISNDLVWIGPRIYGELVNRAVNVLDPEVAKRLRSIDDITKHAFEYDNLPYVLNKSKIIAGITISVHTYFENEHIISVLDRDVVTLYDYILTYKKILGELYISNRVDEIFISEFKSPILKEFNLDFPNSLYDTISKYYM